MDEDGVLKIDGFDNCIVGIATRAGTSPILCYSSEKIIDELINQGMDREEAQEYFGFNIECAFMGKGTPCFIEEYEDMEEVELRLSEAYGA